VEEYDGGDAVGIFGQGGDRCATLERLKIFQNICGFGCFCGLKLPEIRPGGGITRMEII
jgi:hypothetical protein